jgi:hypothetical protein
VVTLDDVARMMLELPEVETGERQGRPSWSVRRKAFAWTRPFSKADIKRYGAATPPDGPIVAVRVADLGEKEAVLAAAPAGFFTIPHFDGYPAILIQLDRAEVAAVREALVDGWLCCAPPQLVESYLQRP